MKKYLLSGLAVLALMVVGCTEKPSGVSQPAGGPKPITSEAGTGAGGSTTGGTTDGGSGPQESATVVD